MTIKKKLNDVWAVAEGKFFNLTGIARISLTLHVRLPKRLIMIIIIIIILLS